MKRAFRARDICQRSPRALPQAGIDHPPLVLAHLRVAVFIALSILAAPFSQAQRGPPRLSDDRELKEIDLTLWDCVNKPGGSAKTPDGVERNTFKNRLPTDVAKFKLQDWDIAAFLKNVTAFDAAMIHKHRKDLAPAERTQLDPMEKDVVELSGYLGVVYCGPPATTNCASMDF